MARRTSCTGPPASTTRAVLQAPAGPRRVAATIARPATQATTASPRALSATRGARAPRPDITRGALHFAPAAARVANWTRAAPEADPAGVRTKAASARPPAPAATSGAE